ncbi:MAG: hypothetical protein K2K54_07735 [Lachnospiraceae bacterium]|nr:hypothetical protein [Lachnospiraceae bacterium]
MAKKTADTGSDTEINGSDKVQASGTQQETSALAVPEETRPDPYDPKLVKEAVKHKNNIRIEFGKIDRSVFKIAFEVHWLYDNQAYIPLGYDNIYDLAKAEFDIARGTASDYINMIYRFGERDDLYNFTGKIMEKYAAYSSSKLVAMHDLTDNEIDSLLKPEMSVREIKGIVNKVLGKSADGLPDNETDPGDKGKDDTSSKKDDAVQGHQDTGEKTENENIPASDPDDKTVSENAKIKSWTLGSQFGKKNYDSDKNAILSEIEKGFEKYPDRVAQVFFIEL